MILGHTLRRAPALALAAMAILALGCCRGRDATDNLKNRRASQ
jgi:hypothetical protein